MAALLQGGGASSDGSTAMWPSHMLLFTFSVSMLLALFHWLLDDKSKLQTGQFQYYMEKNLFQGEMH